MRGIETRVRRLETSVSPNPSWEQEAAKRLADRAVWWETVRDEYTRGLVEFYEECQGSPAMEAELARGFGEVERYLAEDRARNDRVGKTNRGQN